MAGRNVGAETTPARTSQYRERNSTADRALDILGLFNETRLTVSGAEVADVLGVARSTAYRYLQSLVAGGFLEEDPRGGFRLGLRVFELARLARRAYGLSDIALPVMTELSEQTGETVLFTRRVGSSVVCLERQEATHAVRLSYERGSTLPLNAGASAMVLLAWLPQTEARAILERGELERFTARTVTDVDVLLERLSAIRTAGYAVSRGELDEDVLGIAAPVRNGSGTVVAALSIAAVSRRIPDDRLPAAVDAVTAATSRISDQLALTEG
ncbi:IclR family transcriptional regulator [Streptomyces griseoaurantiacus]|uniref:IclR family transcriptional regulator n=1 Tax=Streptomyces griseoaurantiacus TaxID=68213 RepID=UPI00379E10C4